MRYFLALVLPPLAVLSTGRFGAFILNCLLCIFWLPGILHALLVVRSYEQEHQFDRQFKRMTEQRNLLMLQVEMQHLHHQQRMLQEGGELPFQHKRKRK